MTSHFREFFKQISQLASDTLPNQGTRQEKDRLIPIISTPNLTFLHVMILNSSDNLDVSLLANLVVAKCIYSNATTCRC